MMSSSNANNTTSGDNSSDSASHNKRNSKSELEITELKIKKCALEIENLKKKFQREWSIQMTNHLKSFYPDDDKVKKEMFSSGGTSSSATHDSPAELEKRLNLLTKKLHSYEKRKQKLQLDQLKADEDQQNQILVTPLSSSELSNTSSTTTTSNLTDSSSLIKTNSNPNLLSQSSLNQSATNPIQITPTSTYLLNNPASVSQLTNLSKMNLNNHRNGSYNGMSLANSGQKFYPGEDIKSTATIEEKSIFYLNQDAAAATGAAANSKFTPNSATNTLNYALNSSNNSNNNNNGLNTNENYMSNEEQMANNAALLNANKSLQTMVLYQADQINLMNYLLGQHAEKIENLQKKMEENNENLLKEMQQSYNKILDSLHTMSINVYKSYEQKLDDFKQSTLTSMQSLGYNLNHIHHDVKEIKDESHYVKNRFEIIEKTQKGYTVEPNPTNYYQLFYKLLDILLTLVTIILLAFTNLIASIKFVFLLYPRTIVFLLFFYFLFFYLVDFDKLLHVHSFIFPDSTWLHMNHELLYSANKNELNFGQKILHSFYELMLRNSIVMHSPETATATAALQKTTNTP